MKQKLFLLLCLCFISISVKSAEFTKIVIINGIKYELKFWHNLGTSEQLPISAKVVQNDGVYYSGIVTIPQTITSQLNKLSETEVDEWGMPLLVKYDAEFIVTTIDDDAFKDCTELQSVIIPSTLNSIPYGVFDGCVSLNSIIVDESNEVYDSRNGCNAIIRTNGNELIAGCNNTVIPDGINSIGKHAFYNNSPNINDILLPSSISSINSGAYLGCNKISKVYCYSNKCPAIVNEIELNYNDPDNSPIKEYVFEESIYNATLYVHDYAIESFKEDDTWGKFATILPLEKTTDFDLIYYIDGEEYKTVKYKYDDEITPLEEPVRDGYTFSGWSEIPTNMPGKEVKVDGTFTSNKVKEGGVIYHVFNERAAVIGNENATGEVKIAASVTFNEKSVPVTDIVDFSFKNNTDITSVVIPESVRKIGDEAFAGCKNLAKIELGKSVNQIEPRAFASIDKLTDITVYAEDVPDADRTAFENSYTEDYVTLHVPAGSVEKYKAIAPWKNFKEIVPIEGTESEPVKYSLIYQVDGETYQKYELEEGAVITPLEAPTKDGYTFSGWSEIPETMPANDLVIKGTFTENTEDNTEKDEIKIGDIGKTTYCSEYDLDFTNVDGIKAYTATGYDNKSKTIWLTRVITVPAGTGILVKGDAGTYRVPRSTEDAYYTNMFKGNTGDPIKIEETEGDMTNYYLSGKDGSFVSVNGSANIGKNKAYLQLPTKFFAGTRSIGVTYDDEGTTGIWTIEQGTVNRERDVWFNLQGQRVDKPRKGLYILNGKKVVVR